MVSFKYIATLATLAAAATASVLPLEKKQLGLGAGCDLVGCALSLATDVTGLASCVTDLLSAEVTLLVACIGTKIPPPACSACLAGLPLPV